MAPDPARASAPAEVTGPAKGPEGQGLAVLAAEAPAVAGETAAADTAAVAAVAAATSRRAGQFFVMPSAA